MPFWRRSYKTDREPRISFYSREKEVVWPEKNDRDINSVKNMKKAIRYVSILIIQ